MKRNKALNRELKLFLALAAAGVAAALFHIHIPHTDVLIDGRWAFGFMGFALLRRWWAALALAALLSYPYGTPDIPLWVGFGGNLLYAAPSLLVIRPLSGWMLRRWGPGWEFGLGWLALILLCYQTFVTPVVWAMIAQMEGRPVAAGILDGWRTQPYLVESVLVALFSAAALVAVLAVDRLRAQRRRLEHIYHVLLGIRNVNQLIVAEDNPSRLIERACINLTETMGYFNAWIVLLGGEVARGLGLPDAGPVAAAASAGFDGGFDVLRERLDRGEFPNCMKRALEAGDALVVGDPEVDCADCPLHGEYGGCAGLVRRLEFDGVTYGILTASVPAGYANDAEEQDLFNEVAGDLAFALHKIAVARSLAESRQRYSEIFKHSRDGFVMVDADGRIIDANDAFCAMLGYALDEMLALGDFYEITPERWREWEKVEIWQKRLLGRGYSGLYEKEYIRKDGTVFPVELRSYVVHRENGEIDYLWGTARDITERKQAEEALKREHMMLARTEAVAHVGSWEWEAEGDKVTWSDELFRIFGLEPAEKAPPFAEHQAMYVPEDRSRLVAAVEKCLSEGVPYNLEVSLMRTDSEVRHCIVRGIPEHGSDGSVCRLYGSLHDITEIIRAEERIAILGRMLDDAPAGIMIHDTDGRFVFANAENVALHGYDSLEEFMEVNLHELDVPECEALIAERVRKIAEEGEARFEVRHYHKDGSTFPLEVLAKQIQWEGRPAILSIATDITERKQAEQALRKTQNELQAIYNSAPIMICLVDKNRRILYANPAFSDFIGSDEPAVIQKQACGVFGCVHAGQDPRGCGFSDQCHECPILNAINDTLHSGNICKNIEKQMIIERDGVQRQIWLLASTSRIQRPEGDTVLLCMQDITESKQAEEELRRRENLLQRIFETLPIGLWVADKDGTLLRGNPAGVRIWGAEPHVSPSEYGIFKAWRLPSGEPVGTEDWALAKTIRNGVTIVDELLEIEAFDGQRKTILNYTAPVLDEKGAVEGAIVVNLDISDRVALETQLTQAQKMESVGRLAGGVAHDFNNMLNVILGHTELALDDLPGNSPLRDDLDEIRKAAERSANLTRQLLAFARKQTVEPRILDLNETITSMLKMLQRLIGEDIDLLWKPGARLALVRIDPGQVDQVLANLVVNARDAIGHQNGKVTIETANARFDEEYCADHAGFIPGEYVMLAVSDDGCGMDEETRANIFEPFFTTKATGQGTGLGLATIYGITKQNDGFVNVYSEPGKGSTFRIYIPALGAESRQEDGASTLNTAPVGGNENILIVEDEAAILNMARAMLTPLGYNILTASTPSEALRVARDCECKIDLVITDVVMPEMNGRDLAEQMQALYPGLKNLFMSGYTANVIAHQGVLDKGVNFIQKPFSQKDLAEKVRKVLDRESKG
jgi:PAS domain S-box-containing protein